MLKSTFLIFIFSSNISIVLCLKLHRVLVCVLPVVLERDFLIFLYIHISLDVSVRPAEFALNILRLPKSNVKRLEKLVKPLGRVGQLMQTLKWKMHVIF